MRLDKMGQECAELQGVKGRERARLAELEGVPEKIRKQAETEGMAMKGLRVQETKLLDKVRRRRLASLGFLVTELVFESKVEMSVRFAGG